MASKLASDLHSAIVTGTMKQYTSLLIIVCVCIHRYDCLRPEKGSRSPGAGVPGNDEPSKLMLELHQCPMKELQVISVTEPPLLTLKAGAGIQSWALM